MNEVMEKTELGTIYSPDSTGSNEIESSRGLTHRYCQGERPLAFNRFI